jgi:hypothetical protein
MKPLSLSHRVFITPSFFVLLTLLWSAIPASAQQNPSYAPPAEYNASRGVYEQPRQKMTQRVGSFVRNLFYGEIGSRSNRNATNPNAGRSLDRPPSASYRSVPDQPPTKPITTNKPAPTKTPATTASKKPAAKKPVTQYEPPKIRQTPPTPKPEPQAKPKVEETPPAPTPEPKKEEPSPASQTPPSPEPPASTTNLAQTTPATDSPTPSDAKPASNETTAKPEEPKPTTPSTASNGNQFLIGKKTAVPGRVISPYPPHQELDVSGLGSGSLALDPTTNKVFQIP